LLPFEQLEQKAIARVKDSATKALKKLKYELELALEDVDMFSKSLLEASQAPKLDFGIDELRKY
jgi:hypothetical protein